jgi:hypothetical protein
MRRRAADAGWLTLAVLMAVLTALNTVACLISLFGGDLVALLRGAASFLFGYWITVGAWRRTSWGRVEVDTRALGPPLSAGHASAMTLLGVACVIALLLALAIQALLGRT